MLRVSYTAKRHSHEALLPERLQGCVHSLHVAVVPAGKAQLEEWTNSDLVRDALACFGYSTHVVLTLAHSGYSRAAQKWRANTTCARSLASIANHNRCPRGRYRGSTVAPRSRG